MMNFVLISKHEFIGHTKCLQLKQESMSTEAFYNGSRKAYDVAHKRGILDEICSHMKSKW